MCSIFDGWIGRGPAPPSVDPRGLLGVFLRHFLSPAAADGRIAFEEETPLSIAYHALGIRQVEDLLSPGEVERQCREAIMRPWPPPSEGEVTSALNVIAGCAHRITQLEWKILARWLTLATPGLPVPETRGLGARPLPSSSLREFRDLLSRAWPRPQCEPAEPAGLMQLSGRDGDAAPVGAVIFASVEVPSVPAESAPAVRTAEPDPPILEAEADQDALKRVVSGSLARELRLRAPALVMEVGSRLADDWRPWLAFDEDRACIAQKAVLVKAEPRALWIIGDVHGDLLALECALAHIAQRDPDARVLFLGDLVDDGPLSFEVLLRVLALAADRPERVALLPGNHDEGLGHDAVSNLYTSSVFPSDFAEYLNANHSDATVSGVADAFIGLTAVLPRALFFPDGLLVAHGGIPQRDLWGAGRLQCREDLDAPLYLQDFVWTRAHPRAQRRVPDRHSRGAEFGIEDFAEFCEAASLALGRPVERMVRGHDHIPERFSLYANYCRHRIVTINTMSSRLARELIGPFERVPCIARYRPGALPEVHRIRIPADAIHAVHDVPGSEGPPPAAPRTRTA